MKKKNLKEKFKEGKLYKAFRRITSLGVAGALAVLFPNEIIAWLSAGAGILYGKGIIDFLTMGAIVTFLGSAAGILIQKIVLAGLGFLVSNLVLKQGRKLVNFIGRKIKKSKTNSIERNINKIETNKPKIIEAPTKSLNNNSKREELVEMPLIANTVDNNEKAKVKTLGIHPSMRG